MGDDVFEEIPLLHLRVTIAPTTRHHLHLLTPSRRILRGLVGFGEVRSDVVFPVLDGVECVIKGHPDGAITTPKTPHPPHGREGRLRLQGRGSRGALFRGLWLHAGGFSKFLPLSLLERTKDILGRRVLVIVLVIVVVVVVYFPG